MLLSTCKVRPTVTLEILKILHQELKKPKKVHESAHCHGHSAEKDENWFCCCQSQLRFQIKAES